MRAFITLLGLATITVSVQGCATATGALYGEDRLAEITAPQFGLRPDEIAIRNRQATSTGSYYDVVLPSGEAVRCFHDGNVMGLGLMSNPPRCGNQLNQNPLTGR